MCCSVGLSKCFLVLINVIFFIVGVVFLVLGIIAKWFEDVLIELFAKVPDQLMEDVNQAWDIPALLSEAAVMLMIIGIVIFAIGFFGCCGAWKENKCMLGVYVTIVLAIICMELATIIIICVKTQGAEDTVISSLQESIKRNYFDSEGGLSFDEEGHLKFAIRPIKLAWDGIQVAMGCCGAINGTDYTLAHFHGNYSFENFTIQNALVPLSCCNIIDKKEYEEGREDLDDTTQAPREKPSKVAMVKGARNVYAAAQQCLQSANPKYTNQKGCYYTFMDLIEAYWGIFIGIIVVVMVLEIIAVAGAIGIMRAQDKREGYQKA